MTIVKRISLLLIIIIVSLATISGYEFWQIRQSQLRIRYIQSQYPRFTALNAAKFAFIDMRIGVYRHLLTPDAGSKAIANAGITAASKRFDDALDQYVKTGISDSTEHRMLEAERTAMVEYRKALVSLLDRSNTNDLEGARHILEESTELKQAFDQVQKAIGEHFDYNIKRSEDQFEGNSAAYETTFLTSIAGIVAALLLAAALGTYLCAMVRRGLSNLQNSLQDVSHSLDLTLSAPVERMDEIGHTATAFNTLLERMRVVLGSVLQSAESVSTASRQIAAGNNDLSSRTEEQAGSLEQTASSMSQVTTAVERNAESARHASSLAARASMDTGKGSEVVGRLVQTMDGINASSEKIGQITNLIDGIAFQTNILALNAAVEAARAGEQGRGFAVVAGEVRSLAQRSSAAAKEIKELIDASVSTVQDASGHAEEVCRAMADVSRSIGQVNDVIVEIAASAEEQSLSIQQINQAVQDMEQVTQQNAALVEEAAAAAQSLDEQAARMREAATVFRVGTPNTASQTDTVTRPTPLEKIAVSPAPTNSKEAHSPWHLF